MKSGIYQGSVMHRRYTPVQHQFHYPLFMMYLDLAELPTLFDRYWLWSNEKFNWASFWRRDHIGNPQQSLADYIKHWVEKEIGIKPTGPIRLLTQLRFLGYCFNPVSFYYLFNPADTAVEYIVAEVCNTPWGERHCYLLHAGNQEKGLEHTYRVRKALHVSPFMTMDYEYQLKLDAPGSHLLVKMKNFNAEKVDFEANLILKRKEITSKNLAAILIKHPVMTVKVIIAIYWQALRLWIKKVPFIGHPNSQP